MFIIPVLWRLKQEECSEFEPCLGYIVSSSINYIMSPGLNKQKQKKKNPHKTNLKKGKKEMSTKWSLWLQASNPSTEEARGYKNQNLLPREFKASLDNISSPCTKKNKGKKYVGKNVGKSKSSHTVAENIIWSRHFNRQLALHTKC